MFNSRKEQSIKMMLLAAGAGIAAVTALPALANGGSGGGGGGGGTLGNNPNIGNSRREAVDPALAYRTGLDFYSEGKYKKALREFRKVISVDRRNPAANYYAGMSYIGLDKPKRAARYFKTAAKAEPKFYQAHEQYALTMVRLERPEDAKPSLEALEKIAASSNDPRVDEVVARVRNAIETGTVPDQLSLALAPTGTFEAGNLIYSAAVRMINQGQYQVAINELKKAEFEVGLHADIQNYLGYTHRKLGRYEEAKVYYKRALKLNPNHLGAYEYLGELYIETGDMKNARRQLANLDKLCGFGCAEREELARLVNAEELQFASVTP